MVIFVLFYACKELGEQLFNSGCYLACDNYFISPILFMCLQWFGVFAVGTLRENHRRSKEAIQFWSLTNQYVRKNGYMVFARFGTLVFTNWQDSKLVRFLSTIHITPEHFILRVYINTWREKTERKA
ncbi:unnamed protein product, partial [Pylaiella littoralis]